MYEDLNEKQIEILEFIKRHIKNAKPISFSLSCSLLKNIAKLLTAYILSALINDTGKPIT